MGSLAAHLCRLSNPTAEVPLAVPAPAMLVLALTAAAAGASQWVPPQGASAASWSLDSPTSFFFQLCRHLCSQFPPFILFF